LRRAGDRGAGVIRGAVPRRRAGLWLVLAGVVGLVAAVVTLRAASAPPDAGRVVVARQILAPGLLLDEESAPAALAVESVPTAAMLPGTLADPAQALGRRVAVPVGVGEPVTEAALGGSPGIGPAPLSVGERAVPVPLAAAGGGAAGLVAGARVDVVASTGEGPAGRTAVVVPAAEVLAVAADPVADGVGTAGEVLLRVSATQALRITSALNFAREVRLLVRPPQEVPGPPPSPVGAP
jgi:pilus assembly protein CpaB